MMTPHTVSLDDARSLHFITRSKGLPVVFIHGAFATHVDWPDELLEALPTGCRPIVLDRPGHGESARPRFAAEPRAQARQIHAGLLGELDQPAILVAHSHGGLVALSFAEQFPELTAGVVLLAPICLPEVRLVEQSFLGARATPVVGPALSTGCNLTVDRAFLEFVHHQMFAPQRVPESWKLRYPWDDVMNPAAFVAEGEEALAISPLAMSSYRNVARLTMPIRMLLGDADQIVQHALQSLTLAPFLKDVEIEWVKGAGHMVHHCAGERVVQEIRKLLRAVG